MTNNLTNEAIDRDELKMNLDEIQKIKEAQETAFNQMQKTRDWHLDRGIAVNNLISKLDNGKLDNNNNCRFCLTKEEFMLLVVELQMTLERYHDSFVGIENHINALKSFTNRRE